MSWKTILIGQPLDSAREKHERLGAAMGLAVFSSDALSSVAYATEEMLLPLVLGGIALTRFSLPVALAIALLIAVVAVSYMQTIRAYPMGGGAFIVAQENLGEGFGLTAGAALMIDYVMTVTVSISAGVAAITSAFPGLFPYTVEICLAALALIAVVNLRGVRESGFLFSFPVFFFIGSLGLLIVFGLFHNVSGELAPEAAVSPALEALPLLLILRAFSSGCTALTGIEAVANGVRSFKQPEAKNASLTLVWMAALLAFFFIGITYLVHQAEILPKPEVTVLSQLAARVFGGGVMFYALQFATFMILVLAANTAFAGFPSLSSIMARDYYLPRQLMSQGDRLVFSNGILLLSLFAGALIVLFHGRTHAMIPLYTVGVFVAFTLSQAGMVVHWMRKRGRGWRWAAALNGVGAAITGVVLAVVASTKFMHGAWLVLIAIPVHIYLMLSIKKHYLRVASQLVLEESEAAVAQNNGDTQYGHHSVIIPVSGMNRPVLNAIRYARAISNDVVAVYVRLDERQTSMTREGWSKYGMGVPILVLDSPYRSVIEPLLDYIDEVRKVYKDGVITVILPEFVPSRWWEHLLHNHTAFLIKTRLLFRSGVVSTSVPLHLK
ncbi:MAG: APC family permease [Nitrospinae bacterium]|nr:APC family permease [Nitrospinota bacterium]